MIFKYQCSIITSEIVYVGNLEQYRKYYGDWMMMNGAYKVETEARNCGKLLLCEKVYHER